MLATLTYIVLCFVILLIISNRPEEELPSPPTRADNSNFAVKADHYIKILDEYSTILDRSRGLR